MSRRKELAQFDWIPVQYYPYMGGLRQFASIREAGRRFVCDAAALGSGLQDPTGKSPAGGQRRYVFAALKPGLFRAQPGSRETIAYARGYGARSRKNQKLFDSVAKVVMDAQA